MRLCSSHPSASLWQGIERESAIPPENHLVNYSQIEFQTSAFALNQLPDPEFPEIAFAGRSNVGKSSLINTLVNRRKLVKVSSKPGKTQSLNYFRVSNALYLVDLPGYGFAKVPKKVKGLWQDLITSYIESRKNLRCVVVILDIRHPLKALDLALVSWLSELQVPFLPVYTKLDKLSRNERNKNAFLLDAGLNISPDQRILFSAKTGEGKDDLISELEKYCV